MKDNMTFHREELEKLSTQELNKILRAELDSENPKKETVLLALSILENRDPTTSQNRLEGAEEAFANRQMKNFAAETVVDIKKKWSFPKWIGVAAAVVAIAFVLISTVPQAVGAESIFDIIGRWTKDLFNFSDGTDSAYQEYEFKTENEGLQQLYDAVVAQGVTEPVVPMWIPEEYKLDEFKVVTKSAFPKIYARFVKGEYYIQFVIEFHASESTNKYPKDESNAVIYNFMENDYYIVSNEGTWKVIWNNYAECSLVTNDTEDIIYRILNSIQGRHIK